MYAFWHFPTICMHNISCLMYNSHFYILSNSSTINIFVLQRNIPKYLSFFLILSCLVSYEVILDMFLMRLPNFVTSINIYIYIITGVPKQRTQGNKINDKSTLKIIIIFFGGNASARVDRKHSDFDSFRQHASKSQ